MPTARTITALPTAALRALLLTALAFFTLLTPFNAAHAHDTLLGTLPGANTVSAHVPEKVVLQLNNVPVKVGTLVEVKNIEGEIVSTGDIEFEGTTISVPILKGTADSAFTVTWRVVSSDGHPISGSFSFATGPDGSSLLQEVGKAQTGSSNAEKVREKYNTPGETQNDTQNVIFGSLIALGGVVVVIAVVVWFTRKNRDTDEDENL